jgi:glucokinase
MPSKDYILGLDIGGTKTAAILGNHEGELFLRSSFPTRPDRGFDDTFSDLLIHAADVLSEAVKLGKPAACISVSIGGPMDIEKGIIHSPPNLPLWDDIPLKEMLEARFEMPVHIEHDGNAGALAEWFFGAAKGARNVIFLTMGTGFGGGLILDGRLYRGTTSLAGEVGHIRLADTGPVAFGKAGSWEAFCSGTGIGRLAAHRFPKRWKDGEVTPPVLAKLAESGDADALAVFNEVGRVLGRGLAILLDVLNPEVIVIGSLAVRLGDLVLAPAGQVMEQEALPGAFKACRVVPAALGEKLGDIAALCAAIAANRK